jgi:hypothetical protein
LLGVDALDAKLARDPIGDRGLVAGDERDVFDSGLAQAGYKSGGVLAQVVVEEDDGGQGAVDGDVDLGAGSITTCSATVRPCVRSQRALPTSTRCPSTIPSMPWPSVSSALSGRESSSPRCSAPATSAAASGCAESRSSEAASRSVSPSGRPSREATSASSGCPSVIVPVLSSRTVRALPSRSIAPAPLTTIPARAARERPDISAIGAARMSGQGVATTKTASARTGSPDTTQAAPATNAVVGRKNAA